MSSAMLPELSTVLLCGWIVAPAVFPGAIPLLVLGSLFWAWTKYTETIVAQRGSLPSIYQCYYKSFLSRWHRAKLTPADIVPPISAEAADVLFSTAGMFEFDALAASSNASLDAPAEEEQAPAAAASGAVAAPEMPADVKRLLSLTRSAEAPLTPSFLCVPALTMDLAVMTYRAFPLPAWRAQLVRADLTVFMRPMPHRKSLFSFSTVVGAHVHAGGHVEVDVRTDVTVDVDRMPKPPAPVVAAPAPVPEPAAAAAAAEGESGESAAPAAAEPIRRKPNVKGLARAGTRPGRKMLVARVVNTYRFANAAADAPCTAEEDPNPASAAPRVAIPAALAALPATAPARESVLDLSEARVAAFAASSGNMHPRHLSPRYARLLGDAGEEGGVADPWHLVHALLALALAPADARVPAHQPFRVVAQVEGLVAAPATVVLRAAGAAVELDDAARAAIGDADSAAPSALLADLPTAGAVMSDDEAAALAPSPLAVYTPAYKSLAFTRATALEAVARDDAGDARCLSAVLLTHPQ